MDPDVEGGGGALVQAAGFPSPHWALCPFSHLSGMAMAPGQARALHSLTEDSGWCVHGEHCEQSLGSAAAAARPAPLPPMPSAFCPPAVGGASGDVRIGNSEAQSVSGSQGSGSPIGGGLKPRGLPGLPGSVDMGTGQWLFLFWRRDPAAPHLPRPSCPSRNCRGGCRCWHFQPR